MCHGEPLYCGRQAFILLAIMMQSMGNGIMLAFPSVLNSAVLNPDSEDLKITSAEASWLAATIGFTGLLGFFILSPIMQINGRKAVHIIKNVVTLIGWVLLYCAQSITSLYVARAVQGIAMGGIYLNVIIIGEYTHPCRRGYFTAIQKIALSTGALVCHTMSLWCNWRQIAASAIIWNVLSTILTFMWPESPFYLAMRGRYDQCEKSFRWLNGKRTRSKELKDLISHQSESREQRKTEISSRFNKFLRQLKRRDFRKSLLIVAILTVTMDLAGRNYFKAYVFQIMKELTGSTTTAVYISIGSDVSTLTALLISCLTVQYFGRRHLLFTFGISTVVLLYTISVTLYLKTNGIVLVWPWLAPGLILFTNFIVHIGVSPICFAVMGEIFPLELKGLGCSINGIVYTSSYGTLLKITPVLMESIGLGLTYVIYGSCLLVCLVALYFIMPETKDEALLDIENDLKGIKKPVAASESMLKVS